MPSMPEALVTSVCDVPGPRRPDSETAAIDFYGSRSELRARLECALGFAQRTVQAADRTHDLWKVDLGQVSGFEKMVLEASLFALVTARSGRSSEAVWDLVRSIRRNYDSTDALTTLRRQPSCAATLGTTLLVLDSFGLATPQEQTVLKAALDSPYQECSERVPFRLLDRGWVLNLAGRRPVSHAEALRLSAACRRTHPIYMTREDAYAITHSIMYASDFGAIPTPEELRRQDLWHTIDACLAWCLAAGDYDLVAELLLSQLLVRRQLSRSGVVAWRACRRVWDSLGFLPSPSLSAAEFEALDSEAERRQYAHHHMYHTVFVSGLLCNALLMPGVRGPGPDSGHSASAQPQEELAVIEETLSKTRTLIQRTFDVDAGVADEVMARVAWAADEARVAELMEIWQPEGCEALSSAGVVRRMATDAFIIESARAYELGGLAAGLRRASIAGDISPTVIAGAGFLSRQAYPDSPIAPAPSDRDAKAVGVAAALANCLVTLQQSLTLEEVRTTR